MIKSRISRRLILSLLLLTLSSTTLLGVYLLHFFYADNLEKQTSELNRNAHVIELLLADTLWRPDGMAQLSTHIQAISNSTSLRITIIDNLGNVLADSSEPDGIPDNHLTRLEVQGALQHGENSAIRYSDTLHENMLYVAIPVYDNDGTLLGIIRTASSLAPIEASYDKTRAVLLGALCIMALLSTLAAMLIARHQIRPIQQMTQDALYISQGGLERRLQIHTGDELEILAKTINQLTSSLAHQIQAAESSAHQKSLILENMDNGVLLLDSQGKILMANQQAEALLQIAPDYIGRSSIHALGSTLLSTTAREVSLNGQTRTITYQPVIAHAPKTLSVFFAPFRENSEHHVLCVFHDISLLQEMSSRQTEFVSNAAHELATPLTSISGFADSLLDDDFSNPEQSRRFLRTIYEQAQRMNHLIRDLLQLARLDNRAYRQQIAASRIDCSQLPAEAAAQLRPLWEKRQQDIRIRTSETPLYIQANQDLILQILVNLTENAIKYTPEQGTITLTCQRQNADACISIKDTGIGIAEKDIPFIFDRFYRADKARSRQNGGNGIGLSLVRFLTELFDGHIHVNSQPGQGTEFQLRFPLAQATSGNH